MKLCSDSDACLETRHDARPSRMQRATRIVASGSRYNAAGCGAPDQTGPDHRSPRPTRRLWLWLAACRTDIFAPAAHALCLTRSDKKGAPMSIRTAIGTSGKSLTGVGTCWGAHSARVRSVWSRSPYRHLSLSSQRTRAHAQSDTAQKVIKHEWTAQEQAHIDCVEAELMSLPLVRQLLAGANDGGSKDKPAFSVYRPYLNYPREKLAHHMTAGQLRGPGKFAVPPLALIRTADGDGSDDAASDDIPPPRKGDAYVFFHLGRSLCGHEGIIHGGLLATLCDEALAITGFRHFSKRVGVTVRLEVDYKSPAYPDGFLVMQTHLLEGESSQRKAAVKGRMWDVRGGQTVVEAKAIFVEPRDEKLGQSLAGSANAT
ncbi:unnamed protein product [Parajaminaea phylloscopi]